MNLYTILNVEPDASIQQIKKSYLNLAKKYLNGFGRLIIFLSLNKLNKKGCTLSVLSGPPKLNNTTAVFIVLLFLL